MNNWLNIIQKKLLPPRCILCDQPGLDNLDLCADCVTDLPRNQHCCYRCGESFSIETLTPQMCGRCLSNSPDFDDTQAPFLYQGNIRYLITQLKFGHQHKNARVLGSLLANYLQETSELPEAIIPIPLHISRYRQRGFNQSIEIARHVAKQLKLPLDLNSCVRSRDTAQQSGLPAKQRRKNMHRAFNIKKPIPYQHLAIVDDVMTTGATVSALATLLKNNGATKVDVWVCARA